MNEKLVYAELVAAEVGFDLEGDQLTLQFDMRLNGEVKKGRPWRLSQAGAEQLIFQLRNGLDLLRQTPHG